MVLDDILTDDKKKWDRKRSCKKNGSKQKEIHFKELAKNGSNQTYATDMRGDTDYCTSPSDKKKGLSEEEGSACLSILDEVCSNLLEKGSNSTILN